MTFRVLLAVVVVSSTLACSDEDSDKHFARRASSSKRESSDKDALDKRQREKAKVEASGVEERDADDAMEMDQAAAPSDRERADEPSMGDEHQADSKHVGDNSKQDDDEPAGGDEHQADSKHAGGDPNRSGPIRVGDGEKQPDDPPAQAPADGQHEATNDDATSNDRVGEDSLTYYEHAKPIIDAKCGICHMPGGIAPMPFTTYKEVKRFAALMAIDIEGGVMPPWLPTDPPSKFIGDRRLSPEQKTTLLRWIEAGALEGNAQDEAPALPIEGRRSLAQVDESLQISQSYEPSVNSDEYRCFVLEWPRDVTQYVTALEIVPGNRMLVHHAIAYYVKADAAQAVRDRDAEDPLSGYPCFGGVGNAAWLSSYEPGGHADEIPGNVGFEIEPGALMVLQIHYNTLSGSGADLSRIDFTLKDEVERIGDVQLIMDPRWPNGSMKIPMGEPDVVHSYTGRAASLLTTQNYEIYWVDLHMHALGSSGRIGIVRANGDLEELLNIPAWNFGWQETFILREPVTLFSEDKLYVECHFDNTATNQIIVDGVRVPPRDVAWGERTIDEMCLGNVLIAPELPTSEAPAVE